MRVPAHYKSCMDCLLTLRASHHSPINRASVAAITAFSTVYQQSHTVKPCRLRAPVKFGAAAHCFILTSCRRLPLNRSRADLTARFTRNMSNTIAEGISQKQKYVQLGSKDKSLVHLFLAASSYQWQALPGKICHRLDCCVAPLAAFSFRQHKYACRAGQSLLSSWLQHCGSRRLYQTCCCVSSGLLFVQLLFIAH